jgi:hypothetical protein
MEVVMLPVVGLVLFIVLVAAGAVFLKKEYPAKKKAPTGPTGATGK